ncbi:MAG: hypothetical protein AAGE89_04195 [Pseudomonadota bacterium]
MKNVLTGWVLLASVMLCATASLGADRTSHYTKLDFERDCKPLNDVETSDDEPEVGGTFHCRGFRDYPIILKVGDLRESVQYGKIRQDLIDTAWESFAQWNVLNPTTEWRVEGDRPVAAIQRFFIENPDKDGNAPAAQDRGQVLVVSLVATEDNNGTGCVVGYVDARANTNANVLARELADTVKPDHDCSIDPIFHAKRGPLSGTPSRSFPASN